MQKPLIFNSTPLIYLTRVSLANFFKDIPEEKFTTAKVFSEVVKEGKKRGAPEATLVDSLFKEGIIRVVELKGVEYLKVVKEMAAESERQPLHEAEAEVLCLAKELNGKAVADDQVARSVARLLGLELHGAGYILGKVFAVGKIKKEELMEKVNEMRDGGWRVSGEDFLKIVEYLKSL